MDKKFHIVVEGKEDLFFLKNYVRYLSVDNFSPEWFENIKGKYNLVRSNIERELVKGSRLIIIFDANSDYKNTCEEIRDQLNGLAFEVFLFPDNQSDGILENLLEEIIIPEQADIFRCFENYKKCLKKHNYITPNIKGKIYSYKEALGALKENKKEDEFNTKYWNFESPALEPLKDFLLKNLK